MNESIDFMFAAFIFIIIFTYSIANYSNMLGVSNNELNRETFETEAIGISNMLVKTSGYPDNWTKINASYTQNIHSLGLCKEENVIYNPYLEKMNSLSYEQLGSILGINHNYFISLDLIGGGRIFLKGNVSENAVLVNRLVIYNNSLAKLTVGLYG